MPIEVDSEILILDRDEFHLLAHRILGIAFDVHNEFGRLLDESIYKRAIALRCAAADILPARQEVQITVRFLGGSEVALRKIPIWDGDQLLGFDEVCLLCDDTALAFTALTDGQLRMRDHLQRFLGHTRLACIQWINLNHHDIEFTTLLGSGRTMGAGR